MTTNVVIQQPTVATPDSNTLMVCQIKGHRDWSTGLFTCLDDPVSCLKGCCCLPCAVCKISSRLGECCLMPYCMAGGMTLLRTRLRTIGGIKGSAWNDNSRMNWCLTCAVCQMERELDIMGVP